MSSPRTNGWTSVERLPRRAMLFAREKHKNQVRKYTSEPYVSHLAEVAAYTHAVGCPDDYIAAAWLHDVVEDQGVSIHEIEVLFGPLVAHFVEKLTDPPPRPGMNRAERKRMTIERLRDAHEGVQTIKLADLISNTKSIVLHDPKFAVKYLAEKRALLEVLTRGDETLYRIATELANQ